MKQKIESLIEMYGLAHGALSLGTPAYKENKQYINNDYKTIGKAFKALLGYSLVLYSLELFLKTILKSIGARFDRCGHNIPSLYMVLRNSNPSVSEAIELKFQKKDFDSWLKSHTIFKVGEKDVLAYDFFRYLHDYEGEGFDSIETSSEIVKLTRIVAKRASQSVLEDA